MKSDERKEALLELKYCERCGGLWLRDSGSSQVYCTSCRPQVAQLPPEMRRSRKPKLPLGPGMPLDDGDSFEFFDDDTIDAQAAGGVA